MANKSAVVLTDHFHLTSTSERGIVSAKSFVKGDKVTADAEIVDDRIAAGVLGAPSSDEAKAAQDTAPPVVVPGAAVAGPTLDPTDPNSGNVVDSVVQG